MLNARDGIYLPMFDTIFEEIFIFFENNCHDWLFKELISSKISDIKNLSFSFGENNTNKDWKLYDN